MGPEAEAFLHQGFVRFMEDCKRLHQGRSRGELLIEQFA